MFTSSERRGALLLVVLLLLGTGWDLWRARRPPALPPPEPRATAVPTLPAAGSDPPPGHGGASLRPGPPVDLSIAGQAELESLPGIGPVLARRILDHRVRAGGFASVEELLAVPGVGPRLMERLRGRVRAGPGAPAGRDTTPPGSGPRPPGG